MTETSARVLLDSISPHGDRITTVEVVHHRFILAEVNTHRALSRNSASSRAIPVEKMLDRYKNDPAFPIEWRTEKPKMVAGEELSGYDLENARWLFEDVHHVTWLHINEYFRNLKLHHGDDWKKHALHKSWLNRLLEPMQWHTAIWTFDHNLYSNLIDQRKHTDAQPEFRVLAEKLYEAVDASEPRSISAGNWHMPLIQDDEIDEYDEETLRNISVARCARVSYLTHDGVRDVSEDLKLFGFLRDQSPPHASPFEHVCTPASWNAQSVTISDDIIYRAPRIGNLRGWLQYRHHLGM